MFNTRKLAVAFLALVLALPVTDVSLAFAAPESEGGNAVQDSDGVGGDLDSTESSDSLLDEEDPTALAPPGASPLDVDSAKASSEEGTEGLNEDASEGVVVDPTDVIEYVYLDEQVVTLGQEQYIAFGLLDEDAVIAQAEITFLKSSTEEEVSYSTNTVAQNAALFTLEFSDEQDATGYQLLEIAYRVAGSSDTYRADFSALSGQQEGDSYCFDVVTPQVADVLSAEPTEDGEVTAFAITDGGGFVAADSVEDALAIADADGVDKVDAGESIVDPEALSSQDPSDSDATTSPSWLDSLASVLTPLEAYAAASPAREDYLIVALDPGHGASDPGTSGNNLVEKDLNWKIAQACYTELLTYTGVSAMLTRAENENPGLQDRVNRAVACGADVFVSLHNNAGGGTGSEVWVPNNATYNNGTHVVGEQLASKILAQLTKLGLANRGVKTRDNTTNEKYPDGSLADYYTVINASRRAGIPAIIVEHAFLDNASDATKLKDDTFLASLGTADATGIAQQYSLVTAASAQSAALVKYRSHISSLGWETYVYDQKVSGTTGKSRGIEAFDIQLQNQTTTGAIQYNAYVTGIGWQGWKDSGEAAGTTGQSKTVQAMQVRLTGNMANRYDVYYRVHVSNIGWLGWARNGASAGSVGYGYNAEAFEVALVAKGAAAPGSTATPFKESNTATSVAYQAHVAEIGWQAQVTDGATAGTTGRSLRIEALKVSLASQEYPGGIQYNAHCAYIGWQGWRSNGQTAGTTGQSRQMEAVQIMLTGEMADRYDVYYRAHCENFGWLGWAKDGASAGSVGYGYRMEALQVRLVPKGGAAPGSTSNAFREKAVTASNPIIGGTNTNVAQMARYYTSSGHVYPAAVYASKGAPTIQDFCQIVYTEATAEGVRPEVVFCQAMYESGWLGFGGDVQASQCNFCGLKTRDGSAFATFPDVRTGERAHVQHLKAYAVSGLKASDLAYPCVDPRFDLVAKGSAPTLEGLNGKWAVPGTGYGERIASMINALYKA